MSAVLGYERGVNYNNDIINRNRSIQSMIHQQNLSNLTNYNVLEKQAIQNYKGTEEGLEEAKAEREGTTAKNQGGEFLTEARNVYKSAKAYGKIGEDTMGAVADALEGGGSVARGTARANFLRSGEASQGEVFARDLGGAVEPDVNAVINFGNRVGDAVGTATQGARNVAGAVGEGVGAVAGGDLGGVARAVGGATGGIKQISGALDSLGKAGEGLQVLSAGSDILDDAEGKFSKMNTAEKVGNVAGITSGVFAGGSLAGSLESAGAVLDATGIGAELGVGLNVAGALAGGVSAIADYIGSKKKQKPQQPAFVSAPPPKSVAPTPAPVSALQSGGVALSGYN